MEYDDYTTQQRNQFQEDEEENNRVAFNDDEEDEVIVEEDDAYYEDQNQIQVQTSGGGSGSNGGNQSLNHSNSHSPPPPQGKLFVGGISWETTEETFSSYFSKFGEISDSVIMRDRHSGRPRGFGFITFAEPATADRVLEEEHVIDGRVVDVKRTVPRADMVVKGVVRAKKVFVGGIPPTLTEDEMREYFSAYGNIVEHQIMLDHNTGRSRGFGFVTFETEDSVEHIFSAGRTHELGGKWVEIKKAVPRRNGDYGSSAKSQTGFSNSSGGYGTSHSSGEFVSSNSSGGYGASNSSGGGYGATSHSSGGLYGGKMSRGYGVYGGYSGYSGYGAGYGSSNGFYGSYGGYGYGFGFGGPMMYGSGGYGGNIYVAPTAYGNPAVYGGGKGYGRSTDNVKGYGSSGAVNGGHGSGRGYGGNENGGNAVTGRYHPYQK